MLDLQSAPKKSSIAGTWRAIFVDRKLIGYFLTASSKPIDKVGQYRRHFIVGLKHSSLASIRTCSAVVSVPLV